MLDAIVPVISNVGFPIAAAIWLAVRFEKKMEENTQALNSLNGIVSKVCYKLDAHANKQAKPS